MQFLLYLVAFVVVAMYVFAPILIRFSFRFNVKSPMTPVDVPQIPKEALGYFTETAPILETCGFSLAEYLLGRDQVPNVTSYVALWLNRATGQAASMTVVFVGSGPNTRTKHQAEFATKFAQGLEIDTSNSHDLSPFKRTADKDGLNAGGIDNLRTLYALHLSRERRLSPNNPVRYLPPEGQECVCFNEALAFDLHRQVKQGYLFEAEPDVFRPTWAGAYRMTWSELPPIKQLRQKRLQARVQSELAESQTNPTSPPHNVTITHESPYRAAALEAAMRDER